MPINYWRHVSYDGDGHAISQCLRCYNKIYCHVGHDWNFCPHCGTPWAGQWPPEEVRREQERIETASYRAASDHDQTHPQPYWEIQRRRLEENTAKCRARNVPLWVGPWESWWKISHTTTAKQALDEFRRVVRDYGEKPVRVGDPCEITDRPSDWGLWHEYRMQLVRPAPQPPFYKTRFRSN